MDGLGGPTETKHSNTKQKGLLEQIRHSKLAETAMVVGALTLAGCSNSGEKASTQEQYDEGKSDGVVAAGEEKPASKNETQPIPPEAAELDTSESQKEYFEAQGMEMAKKTVEFIAAHKVSIQNTEDTSIGEYASGFTIIDRENENGFWMASVHEVEDAETLDVLLDYEEYEAGHINDYTQTIRLEAGEDWANAGSPESVDEIVSWLQSPDDLLDVQGVYASKSILDPEELGENDDSDRIELRVDELVTITDDTGTIGGRVDGEQLQNTIQRAQEMQNNALSQADLR